MNQNVLKFCRNFFVDFRVQASFGAFWATPMKILTRAYLYVVYIPWKFQSCILNRFGYKFRTTRPSKFDKIDYISRPEVTSSKQKKKYIKFLWFTISPENFMEIDRTVPEKSAVQNQEEKSE